MSGTDQNFTERSKDDILKGGQTGALKDIDKGSEATGSKQQDGVNAPDTTQKDATETVPQAGKLGSK